MKVRILRTPLAIALLGGMSISVCYAAVSVSLVPLREVYHPGEPVAVLLSLKNTGRVPVEIPISGCPPDASAIGLTFRCPPGVEPVPLPWEVAEKGPGPNAPVVLYSRDRYMPLVRILPKKEYRLAVALNKYMRFVATGRHVIRYSAKYPGFIQNDPGSRTLTGITLPEVKGEIAIVIKAGAIDEKWIKSLIAILKGPGKAPPPDAAQGEEQISREDAAGLLVWADTPIVIEPLIAAAEDPSMPNVPAIVIPSLQKFYRKHECAGSNSGDRPEDRNVEKRDCHPRQGRGHDTGPLVQADLRLQEHPQHLAGAGIYPRHGTRDDVRGGGTIGQ